MWGGQRRWKLGTCSASLELPNSLEESSWRTRGCFRRAARIRSSHMGAVNECTEPKLGRQDGTDYEPNEHSEALALNETTTVSTALAT